MLYHRPLIGQLANDAVAVPLIPSRRLPHQGDQRSRVGGDALDAQQVLVMGLQHLRPPAEAGDQRVCQPVGIPIGDGVIQQHLQYLVGIVRMDSALKQTLLHPLTVAVVEPRLRILFLSHGYFPLFYLYYR